MEKINILIADDNIEIRTYFKNVLEREKDIKVIGLAESGMDVIKMAEMLHPDIILMDLQMKYETDGITAIGQITQELPEIKCIALTIHEEEEYLFQAYAAGAIDYIIKTDSIAKVVNSIYDVFNNKLAIRPEIAHKILEEFSRLNKERNSLIYSLNLLAKLTNSELEILRALYYGATYSLLARERFVEEVTIRTQVTHILKKFEKRRMKEVLNMLKESKLFETYDFLNNL